MTSRGPERVFLLGAGRAGRGLARAFSASGLHVVGLHGRRPEPASDDMPGVSAGQLPAAARKATVIIVAVRDGQLDDALRELLAAGLARETVILHASGASEPAALRDVRAAGHPAGTFHPLLPLADPVAAPRLFRGAWVGVDGDAAARGVARRLAERLGAHALEIPRGEKARYHAAAVFASNFPTVLAALAVRLLGDAGVDREQAWAATRALLAAASANLEGRSPAAALTGPVARGDADTIRRHIAALEHERQALDAYVALSRVAVELAMERGSTDPTLAEIRDALGASATRTDDPA